MARQVSRFHELTLSGLRIGEFGTACTDLFPENAVIVHTIPPLIKEENNKVRQIICALEPSRVIYLSSTSVYGKQVRVDAESLPEPVEEKALRRVEEEGWLTSQPWPNLVLRPAAIYGPGRGVHVRLQEGRAQRAKGAALVSRIHVEDLAELIEAGTGLRETGAWPVADDLPCSTDEITEWCRGLLQIGTGRDRYGGGAGAHRGTKRRWPGNPSAFGCKPSLSFVFRRYTRQSRGNRAASSWSRNRLTSQG